MKAKAFKASAAIAGAVAAGAYLLPTMLGGEAMAAQQAYSCMAAAIRAHRRYMGRIYHIFYGQYEFLIEGFIARK